MIRLMCKSRTGKIRRMMFSAMTAFAILVQAFSFPSYALNPSAEWGQSIGSYSGTTNLSWSNAAYYSIISSSQYLTSAGISSIDYYPPYEGSSGISPGHGSIVGPSSYKYFTGGYCYVYWPLYRHYPTIGYQYRINGLSISHGSVSGFDDNSIIYMYGSDSDIVNGTARPIYTDNPSNSSWVTPVADSSRYCIWLRATVFIDSSSDPDISINTVSCSFSSIDSRFYTGDVAVQESLLNIEDAINQDQAGVVDAIQDQTQEVTEGYDNSQTTNDNEQLAGAMQDYDNSQSAAVGDSTGYIDDVSFFNPSSSAQVMSGITLTGSFLQSLFENMGQWSAVVLVSLSLTFGLMLVGWFKFRK